MSDLTYECRCHENDQFGLSLLFFREAEDLSKDGYVAQDRYPIGRFLVLLVDQARDDESAPVAHVDRRFRPSCLERGDQDAAGHNAVRIVHLADLCA